LNKIEYSYKVAGRLATFYRAFNYTNTRNLNLEDFYVKNVL